MGFLRPRFVHRAHAIIRLTLFETPERVRYLDPVRVRTSSCSHNNEQPSYLRVSILLAVARKFSHCLWTPHRPGAQDAGFAQSTVHMSIFHSTRERYFCREVPQVFSFPNNSFKITRNQGKLNYLGKIILQGNI